MRITDEQGKVVYSVVYDPYGNTVYESDGHKTHFKFTDQEKDEESGLYYYGARYYDPFLGRFIQPDPVLDDISRYAYCHNNPVKYTDPTGNTTEGNIRDARAAGAPDFVIGAMHTNMAATSPGYMTGLPAPTPTSQQAPTPVPTQTPNGSIAQPPSLEARRRNRINQNDDSIKDLSGGEMGKNGCCFRSCQGVAEEETNTNLTDEQIKESVVDLQSKKTASGDPVVDDHMSVNSLKAVIEDAFDRLDNPEVTVDVTTNPTKNGIPDYTITKGNTQYGNKHFTLADSKGSIISDPLSPDRIMSNNVIKYYVYINR